MAGPAAELIDMLVGLLQRGDGDESAAIESLVRLGAMLRTQDHERRVTAEVVRRVEDTNNPQLIGLLSCALGAYDNLPRGLIASEVRSPCIPSELVVGLVTAQSLGTIPADWDDAKQIRFWQQFFLDSYASGFLPRSATAHLLKLPPPDPECIAFDPKSVGFVDQSIALSLPRVEIADPELVDAIFQRVSTSGEKEGRVLAGLLGLVSMSDQHVAAEVEAVWWRSADPSIRQRLMHLMSSGQHPGDVQILYRVFCLEPDPGWRSELATEMLDCAFEDRPGMFRILWLREHDPGVQNALASALASHDATDAALEELGRAYDTSMGEARAAVRKAAVDLAKTRDGEIARRVLRLMSEAPR